MGGGLVPRAFEVPEPCPRTTEDGLPAAITLKDLEGIWSPIGTKGAEEAEETREEEGEERP